MGCKTLVSLFSVNESTNLHWRLKTHINFFAKSNMLSVAENLAQFTADTKWVDWMPYLIFFLTTVREGVFNIIHKEK